MSDRWGGVIGLALLVLVAVAGSSGVVSEYTKSPSYAERAEEADASERQQKPDKFSWDWFTADAITVFTGVLTVLTFALAAVAIVQIRYLIRADRTARISADAAKRAADIAGSQVEDMKASIAAAKASAEAMQTSANAAIEANVVARQSLVIDQRPWISVDLGIASPFTFKANGDARFTLLFSIKSFGKSPALNVWVDPEVILLDGTVDPVAAQREKARKIKSRPMGSHIGRILFPGEPYIYQHGLMISKAEIDRVTAIFPQFLSPFIIGSVSYRFAFAADVHQTGFIASLNRIKPGYPGAAFAIEIKGGDIPQSELFLERQIFGPYLD